MAEAFQLAKGIEAPDLSGIDEGYSVKLLPDGYHHFIVNVSAENIPAVFRRLAAEVKEPAFFLLEVPTHRDIEEELRESSADPFHRDIYYLDGLSWTVAEDIFARYEYLLTHDGQANFGFGSHNGHDEVLVGAYKIFSIYADEPTKYQTALRELGYGEVPEVKTVWDNFTRQSPGSRKVLADAVPTLWQAVEELKERGLYLAERREE